MEIGYWVVIIAFILGCGGILVGLGYIRFPWKESILEEDRNKELKKVVRTGLLLLLLAAGQLLALIYQG